MQKSTKISLLLGAYISALYAATLLGGKLLPVFNSGLSFAIFAYPFVFLILSIITETQGKKEARRFAHIGLFSLLLLLVWQLLAITLPAAAPNEWYENTFNPAYEHVFTLTLTFTLASIVGFIFGQHITVIIYQAIRKITGDKMLWLRNNVSTILAQFIDTTLFIFIAFSPRVADGSFTVLGVFITLVIPYWIAKTVFFTLNTPFAYLGKWWLKR